MALPLQLGQFRFHSSHEALAVHAFAVPLGLDALSDFRADDSATIMGKWGVILRQVHGAGAPVFLRGVELPAPLIQPLFDEVAHHVIHGPVFIDGCLKVFRRLFEACALIRIIVRCIVEPRRGWPGLVLGKPGHDEEGAFISGRLLAL
jgi:hypothetical protein